MSNTAARFTMTSSTSTSSMIYDWKVEAQSYLSGRADWREALRPAPMIFSSATWDRPGCEKLVADAKDAFTEATGIRLPYNLEVHGPWVNFPAEGRIVEILGSENPRSSYTCREGTTDRMVGTAARVSGWLKGAAKSRFLTKMLEKSTSHRGMFSPATSIDVYRLVDRYTPGAAERRGRAVKERADEILSPYGLKCSWRGVGSALTYGAKATGKAATTAAAVTLGFDAQRSSYKAARSFLASVSRTVSSREDDTDGVSVTLVGPDLEVKFKVSRRIVRVGTATKYFGPTGNTGVRRLPGILLECAGRTFHSQGRWGITDVQAAVWEAENAWRQQRNFERVQRRRAAARRPDTRLDRVCVLVRVEDSLNAGNCRLGTEAFQREHRWGDRWYIPTEWLRATHSPRAWNAAAEAEREVLKLM
ncbi:MAG: hypothetical protein EOM21_15920 [Gammaproteobacteria bacterium]|nr:hypothetical protein [Gammaproteobacteria bacterium]